MKKIIKYGLMWITTLVLSLVFLKLANDVSSFWINISWAAGVWFGIETILYHQVIDEWKKNKLILKGVK